MLCRLPVLRLGRLLLGLLRAGLAVDRPVLVRLLRLGTAVDLAVLRGLPILRLSLRGLTVLPLVGGRLLLTWTALIGPDAAVPVALLGLVLGIVIPTDWEAHGQSIAHLEAKAPSGCR